MELGITREEAEFFLNIIRFYWKSLKLTEEEFDLLYPDVDLKSILMQLNIIKEIGVCSMKNIDKKEE